MPNRTLAERIASAPSVGVAAADYATEFMKVAPSNDRAALIDLVAAILDAAHRLREATVMPARYHMTVTYRPAHASLVTMFDLTTFAGLQGDVCREVAARPGGTLTVRIVNLVDGATIYSYDKKFFERTVDYKAVAHWRAVIESSELIRLCMERRT